MTYRMGNAKTITRKHKRARYGVGRKRWENNIQYSSSVIQLWAKDLTGTIVIL
jgi:hypothetical protein